MTVTNLITVTNFILWMIFTELILVVIKLDKLIALLSKKKESDE